MLREMWEKYKTSRRSHDWRRERHQPEWLKKSMFTREHKYISYYCIECGQRIAVASETDLAEKHRLGCTGRMRDRETTGVARA